MFFSDNTRGIILIFLSAKREIFFQNLTLGYMTKTLNQIIIFFLHQNQNIFFSNIGNQNIFLKKNPIPPRWKLNGPSLSWSVPGVFLFFKLLMSFCISSLEGGSVSISRSTDASGIIASSSGSFRLRTS